MSSLGGVPKWIQNGFTPHTHSMYYSKYEAFEDKEQNDSGLC